MLQSRLIAKKEERTHEWIFKKVYVKYDGQALLKKMP